MKSKKPVVYFVFRTNTGDNSTRFGGFAKRMLKYGYLPDAEYRTVALDELTFTLDINGDARIYGIDNQPVFEDASFVYFKSWEGMPERACAVATYLQARGVPFEDHHVIHMGVSKLSQMYQLWSKGVAYIPTITSTRIPDEEFVIRTLGAGPYIVKPISGEKGNDNYLCGSYAEAKSRIESFPKGWLLQKFIANKGDYRVWVYGYDVKGSIFRKATQNSHLNNTSKGASSEFIPTEKLQPEVVSISRQSAQATGNAVAGVDIMPGDDGRLYVLEVNQGSQIVSGHESDKKMKAFGEFISSRLHESLPRISRPNRLKTIGRYVHVNLPEFATKEVFAKVDTGAYQSALHATNIREDIIEDQKVLIFTMLEGHGKANGKEKECIAHDYDVVRVKSSTGTTELRYRIRTRIALNGIMMKTPITLTNRSDMVSPLLLGRRFLRGRYIVNVELSRKDIEEMK